MLQAALNNFNPNTLYAIMFVRYMLRFGVFSLGIPASSTNKTDRNDISVTKILLKVVLNTNYRPRNPLCFYNKLSVLLVEDPINCLALTATFCSTSQARTWIPSAICQRLFLFTVI